MLFFFSGTDTEKARAAIRKEIEKRARGADIVRITDAHSAGDARAALQGGGMFGSERVVVFEHLLQNEATGDILMDYLESLRDARELYFVLEEKVLAPIRKKFEKYAEKVEIFDRPKEVRDNSIFLLANALQRRDKKALWVGYMQELAKGSAPEMIHGILFWSAKQNFLKSSGAARQKAADTIAALAELPHKARRNGFDMEYALERFVLSVT